MRTKTLLLGILGCAGLAVGGPAAGQTQPPPAATGDQGLIASAMQAAPRSIAEGATVVAMEANGQMRTLRQGRNGWTCMPDNPTTPGPDPMCMDGNALAWAHAWIGKQPPPQDKVGLMYMLAGGTDASNTDPYAQRPTEGNAWIETGPHLMIVGAPAMRAMQDHPREPKPDTARPYVMWAGTPYEHLMVPVR
jgi:hypothetical protein